MRMVAAMIAAVMSVATGGPLRCPCHFAALLRDTPCTAKSAPAVRALPTAPTTARHLGCGCKSHKTADEPPTEGQPVRPAQPEPCKHGPGIDLVVPTAVDRQSGDLGADDCTFGATSEGFPSCPALVRHGLTGRPVGSDSSLPALLRYSHAFRC